MLADIENYKPGDLFSFYPLSAKSHIVMPKKTHKNSTHITFTSAKTVFFALLLHTNCDTWLSYLFKTKQKNELKKKRSL